MPGRHSTNCILAQDPLRGHSPGLKQFILHSHRLPSSFLLIECSDELRRTAGSLLPPSLCVSAIPSSSEHRPTTSSILPMLRSGLPVPEDVLVLSLMGVRCPCGCVSPTRVWVLGLRELPFCSRMGLKSAPFRTPVWDTHFFLVLGNPEPRGLSDSSHHRVTPPAPYWCC